MVAAFLGLGRGRLSLVHGAAGSVITGAVFLILGYALLHRVRRGRDLVSRQSDVGEGFPPVQVPLIIAYALSYTVIYADGADVFHRVPGFLPPTAPIAMPVLYAAATCRPGRRRSPPSWPRRARSRSRAPRRPSTAIDAHRLLVRLGQVLTRGAAD